MRIELEENEIKSALVAYINSQGFNIDEATAEVDLKNARGDFGVTATISMKAAIDIPAEPKKVTPIKKEKIAAKGEAKDNQETPEVTDEKEPATTKPLFS